MQAPVKGDYREQSYPPTTPYRLLNRVRKRRTENGRDNSVPHRDTTFRKTGILCGPYS